MFQYIYNSNPWRKKQWNEVEVSHNRCPQQKQDQFQEMEKKKVIIQENYLKMQAILKRNAYWKTWPRMATLEDIF